MKNLLKYFLLLYILAQYGCGTIVKFKKDDSIYVPAGIDSLTAVVSDSITNRLFVSEARKSKASTLYYKAKQNYEIADSLSAILTSIKQVSHDSLQIKKKGDKDELTNLFYDAISKAENDLKKGIKLNPFDINIKDLLAYVYFIHGNLSHNPKFYQKSILLLKEIISREKSEHILYYRLGENYYKLNDWNKAYQNYRLAEWVLLETAFYNKKKEKKFFAGSHVGIDSVDTNVHFRYVYYQAITISKLYNTELALSLFQRAQQIASLQDQLKLVENYTKWIKWDGGNIAASEKKNTLLQYVKEKKYEQAKSGLEELIDELNTQKAKDEISWRVACIEYEFLGLKEHSCQRLYEIVKNTLIDKINGLPIDTDYCQYFTDCGTMFFKLGLEYKKKSRYKDALRCFANASQIQWIGKWKSLLELAKLSNHDSERILTLISQILNGEHNLNRSEQLDALILKLNALKRFGESRLEEVKNTYRQIRSMQNKLN